MLTLRKIGSILQLAFLSLSTIIVVEDREKIMAKQNTVRGIVADPAVSRQLVDKLSSLKPGPNTVRVTTTSGTIVTLSAVQLTRSGKELVKTKTP